MLHCTVLYCMCIYCICPLLTGNDNTVGGGLVYPVADLGKLRQLEAAG